MSLFLLVVIRSKSSRSINAFIRVILSYTHDCPSLCRSFGRTLRGDNANETGNRICSSASASNLDRVLSPRSSPSRILVPPGDRSRCLATRFLHELANSTRNDETTRLPRGRKRKRKSRPERGFVRFRLAPSSNRSRRSRGRDLCNFLPGMKT